MATKKVLDFTNVKERDITKKRVPEGWHPMVLIKVDDHEKDGSDGWRFVAKIDSPDPHEGETYPIYCMHEENQLWKLRKLAAAAGFDVPKKRISLTPERLLNRPFAGYLVDDEYEGRENSEFGDQQFLPLDEITDTMWAFASDEEPATPAKRRKRASEPEPDPEEPDEEEAEEEPEPPPRKAKGKAKVAASADDDDIEEVDLDEL